MRGVIAVVCLLCAGCFLESDLVDCGDLLCPVGAVCTANGCAQPEQIAACAPLVDDDDCTTPQITTGVCVAGVCEPVVCGDSKIVGPEACDDGNLTSGDGCSADCLSDEVCGNGYVDGVNGEQCDDLIHGLARDGCTSQCTSEVQSWFDVTPQAPPGQYAPSLGFYPPTGQVVMFGKGETWTWDGSVWQQHFPLSTPQQRDSARMAYDPDRKRLVLHGGFDYYGDKDTWLWDGVTWTRHHQDIGPPESDGASMAWDPVHHVIVLFHRGETWTWDGSLWTKHTTPTQPASDRNHTMAWDSVGSRALLFDTSTRETWGWDGSAWSKLTTTGLPPAGDDYLMATAGGVYLYASQSAGDEMWKWVNNNWVKQVAQVPEHRYFFGITYDPVRNRGVLFGGQVDSQFAGVYLSNEIHEWNDTDSAWMWIETRPQPSGEYAAMTYVPERGNVYAVMGSGSGLGGLWEWNGAVWRARTGTTLAWADFALTATANQIVFQGGISESGLLDVTWVWDGNWTQKAAGPIRIEHAMAWDSKRDRVLLFGGELEYQTFAPNDTWEWDGATWTQRFPAHSPPARKLETLVYDPIREEIVMFGGQDTAGPLDDTWVWDGDDWTQRMPATSPSPRASAAAAFNPDRGTVYLFGGFGDSPYSDTWEWNGTNWLKTAVLQSPPSYGGRTLAYDAHRGELVLFGKRMDDDRTWVHRFVNPTLAPDSCAGSDSDGDMLVGCDDPDCWARCRPLCPPHVTDCAPNASRCGDGTCNTALEDHALCPGDCP